MPPLDTIVIEALRDIAAADCDARGGRGCTRYLHWRGADGRVVRGGRNLLALLPARR